MQQPKSSNVDSQAEEAVGVCIRIRPLNARESRNRESIAVETGGRGVCMMRVAQGKTMEFKCNQVIGPSSTQDEVFDCCGVKRILSSAVQGYAGTVFAYGQTGSGKTFSLLGSGSSFKPSGDPSDGLMPRSAAYIFALAKQQPDREFSIRSTCTRPPTPPPNRVSAHSLLTPSVHVEPSCRSGDLQ
jgi:hypothetical protein